MTAKQIMVQPLGTERGLGTIAGYSTADSAILQKAFPQSPVHDGSMTDESVTKEYQDICLEGPINNGWQMTEEFDPNFAGSPSWGAVKTGAGGWPANAFVPNIASPGAGSADPTDLPAPPNAKPVPTNHTFGAGSGLVDPEKTAEEISKTKMGDYVMGQSVEPGTGV
jgi:hypothetical protein